ncbi:MAG: hypothetical protein JRM80_06895 [Nitrososphaerota archaeon]|nr:hypothetical protein [Nitrososphaerota archaeon]
MEKMASRLLAISTIGALLIACAPAALASSITVNLNPTTKVAKFDSVSTTSIILTYPANSSLSNYLKGYNSSQSFTGTFSGNSDSIGELQNGMDDLSPGVRVLNATVTYSYKGTANATELVVNKMTEISGYATGVFKVVNGSVTANVRWRSFSVPGALDLSLDGRMVDVNLVGSSLMDSMIGRSVVVALLTGFFGGGSLWNRPTIDFSALSSPLSAWTKNYDSATNTTTFTKTVNSNSSFNASQTSNGQTYTLKVTSDPSAVISVQGYAQPSGDALIITSPPPGTSLITYVGIASAVVILALGAITYLILRRRSATAATGTVPTAAKTL